jgi:hypothetical protein
MNEIQKSKKFGRFALFQMILIYFFSYVLGFFLVFNYSLIFFFYFIFFFNSFQGKLIFSTTIYYFFFDFKTLFWVLQQSACLLLFNFGSVKAKNVV